MAAPLARVFNSVFNASGKAGKIPAGTRPAPLRKTSKIPGGKLNRG
jgi:hypothetical protein